jgi:hypothetical protein
MKRLIAAVDLLLMVPALASAQNADHHYRGQGYFFFGLGTGIGRGFHPVVEQAGFGGEGFLYKGLGLGGEAEYARWGGPVGGYTHQTWIGSTDVSYHFRRRAARSGIDPFVLGGFSLYGPTSNGGGRGQPGGNFGVGVSLWLAQHAALRLEIRDHLNGNSYLPGGDAISAISFRVGVTFR